MPGGPTDYSVSPAGVLAVAGDGAPAAGATVLMTVQVVSSRGSSVNFSVAVIGAPDITVATVGRFYVRLNETPVLTTLKVTGGVEPFSFAVEPADVFGVTGRTLSVWQGQTTARDVVARVAVTDVALGRVAVTMTAMTRFYSPVFYSPSLETVAVAVSVDANQLVYPRPAQGGAGEGIRYSVVSVTPSSIAMTVGGDGRVSLMMRLDAEITATAVVQARDEETEETATLTLVVLGVSQPVVSGFASLYFVPAGVRATLVTLQVAGGLRPYSISERAGGAFELAGDGRVVVFQGAPRASEHVAVVRVADGQSPPKVVFATLGVSVFDPLRTVPPLLTQTVAMDRTGAVHTVTATGGSGGYVYAVGSVAPSHAVAVGSDGVLDLQVDLSGVPGYRSTVMVSVSDGRIEDVFALQTVVLRGVEPLTATAVPVVTLRTDTAVGTGVLTLSVGGGLGGYVYSIAGGDDGLRIGGDGVLRLGTAGVDDEVRVVTVRVRDGTVFNELAVAVTVSFYAGLEFSPASASRRVAEDFVGVVQTVGAVFGLGTVSYSIRTPGASVDGGGRVRLVSALGGTDGVVTVWATDESGDAPVGFVLSLLSVPELGLGRVPTLYVPVGGGSGLALWTLTATGGDGSGVVFWGGCGCGGSGGC